MSEKLNRQIYFHFIYNVLQCIAQLCDKDPGQAKEAIYSFADYLRADLEGMTEMDAIPFERELVHTRAYLELERLIAAREFEVEYRLAVTDFMLPPLSLQPVVENAVRHGASSVCGFLKILIETYEKEGNIYVAVTNQAEPITEDKKGDTASDIPRAHKKSVALDNVRTRLAIQSGGTITIESIATGTTVTLMIPDKKSKRQPLNRFFHDTQEKPALKLGRLRSKQFWVPREKNANKKQKRSHR